MTIQSQVKATIIRTLTQERDTVGAIDSARRMYQDNQYALTDSEKREIAVCVHCTLEPDVALYFFPDVADPMTGTKVKANIIQILIQRPDAVDKASRMYQANQDILFLSEQREISMYVHRHLPTDLVPYYFPDLPYPMTGAERDNCQDLPSVEEMEKTVLNLQAEFAYVLV